MYREKTDPHLPLEQTDTLPDGQQTKETGYPRQGSGFLDILLIMLIYHCYNQGVTNTHTAEMQSANSKTHDKLTNRTIKQKAVYCEVSVYLMNNQVWCLIQIPFVEIIVKKHNFSSALFSKDASVHPCPVYINYSGSCFFSVHLSVYAFGFIRKQSLASPSLFTYSTIMKTVLHQELHIGQICNAVPAFCTHQQLSHLSISNVVADKLFTEISYKPYDKQGYQCMQIFNKKHKTNSVLMK